MSHFHTIGFSDPRLERDGVRHVTVKSAALKGRADISLYVPPTPVSGAEAVPVVILLHGVYGSHWSWTMQGGAHVTAQRLIETKQIEPIILAMPSDGMWGDGSGYMPHRDRNVEQWIVDEVLLAVLETTSLASERSPLFIAGLSMGGFGALRLGATYPERFAGISGHSSITNLGDLEAFLEEDLLDQLSGNTRGSLSEVLLEAGSRLPPLRFDCGLDDALLASNRDLSKSLEEARIDHIYQEFPGNHEWSYWEAHLEDTLLFFQELLASDGQAAYRHKR